MKYPQINAARLLASVEQMACVGATATGGVERVALTPADCAGRALLREWATEAGCGCRLDAVGNLFIRREGTEQRPAVAFGSHLDTQPEGGAYDGALGVLAGLELMRSLHDHQIETMAPLELVVWTDEEGARFEVSCVGSSIFSGAMRLAEGLALTDADGVSVGDALQALEQRGEHDVGSADFDSYFELHIEQGPELEEENLAIGVVEGIFGIRWLEITVKGRQAHAGTTPMDRRADALAAAAALVGDVRRLGRSHGADGRGTVCVMDVEPNAGSVIPGRVRVMVDLRHSEAEELDRMQAEMNSFAHSAADKNVSVEMAELWMQPPIRFDATCIDLVDQAARHLGLASKRMLSGAGHDAGYVARIAPTAMIFIPCRGGVSHHPAEYASPEQVANGAQVLAAAVLARAGIASLPARAAAGNAPDYLPRINGPQ